MKLIKRFLHIYNIVIGFTIFTSVYSPYLHAHGFSSHSLRKDDSVNLTFSEPPENQIYKRWCEKTFINGALIYEAYRQVAFNITYAQEPPHNDFWQTPYETKYRRAGDCEDAVLLFNHILSHKCDNGRIMWGVIEDLKEGTEFAHVWFELCDRRGQLYLVEPFTKNWNGIVLVEQLKDKKVKKVITGIPNKLISDLFDNPLELEHIKSSVVKKEVTFNRGQRYLIDDIFAKLRRVSRRYVDQKRVLEKQGKH